MPALPGLDLDALAGWLDREHPGLRAGPLTARLVAGGRSNLTYTVRDGEHRWVLRRPPLGHVLATAHDMSREHRVMAALAGTAVPVPAVVALCPDGGPLGAPFYLMAQVEGVVVRTAADAAQVPPARREGLGLRSMDVLADLHAVDPASVGLADFGRPQGFLARQVRRWGQQLAASRSRDLAGVEELHEALTASAPDGGPAGVVHGDYRLDNLVVDPTSWQVAAVLDWEMSTLGDPMADLGLLVAYTDGLAGVGDGASPVAQGADAAHGFPTTDALVQRYAERSGHRPDPLRHLGWCTAFGYFKIAVILEGIHYRYVHGQTVGDGFDRIGDLVPPLVERGLDAVRAVRPRTVTG